MQTHLKERLTGAVLLVVIVVLLVPAMFRGHPAPASQSAGSALDGPPERTYNIDLRDNDGAQPLPAGAPLSASAAQTASVPAATETPALAPPAAAPAPVEARQPEEAPRPVVTPPASAPPSVPAHAAVRAGWTVQVGSFARHDFAERMVRQMKAKGFAVQVAGPDDKGLYRVRSAAFTDRARAMALRQQMLQTGLKPIVNTLP
ncbi:MAG TPA: SPOR domain-containing protein [Steroidobacteraceae bacterium]|nr:SPOR domain-containing protein [Steroidobacteraceae bacterium]